MNILHAKGKEYPLVLSNLDNLSDNEIYLIMTRAQFELDFVTKYTVCSNRHLQTLIDKKWINKKDVLDFQNTPEGISEISSQDQNNSVSTEQIPTTISAGATIDGIVKHTGSVEQLEDEIQPSIIIDEQRYKDDFLKQLNLQQSLPRKKEVVFIKKDIDKDTTRLNNEIKIFLYNTYKGYCQSCGFTFRKLKDSQNSFEKFNWNDKRIVKVKKDFVSSADSICLCRNCAANIKFGDFNPIFVDKIQSISDFENKNLEEITKDLHNVIDMNVHDIFKEHIDFDEIFALEIELNKKNRNLYFTKEHLIQFITFLQLEEKCLTKDSVLEVIK